MNVETRTDDCLGNPIGNPAFATTPPQLVMDSNKDRRGYAMGETCLPSVHSTDNPALDGLIRSFHTDSDETFSDVKAQGCRKARETCGNEDSKGIAHATIFYFDDRNNFSVVHQGGLT